ncbi:MAG: ATP-dependent DNA helicase [Planctomycetota bacterium]
MSDAIELPALSDEQRRAVMHDAGPLIVLAGPGTGKTRVITARIARLIDGGVPPSEILSLTFTNKAAGELRERLSVLIGPSRAELVRAGTFHWWSLDLLRRFADRAGLAGSPRLADSAEVRRVMREAVRASELLGRIRAGGIDAACDRVARTLAALKHRAIEPGEAAGRVRTLAPEPGWSAGELELLAASCEAGAMHERLMGERGLLALDDLIARASRLLAGDALVREIVRSDARHVLVDEFQDVDAAQIALLRRVRPPEQSPCDICVVGDDDQSIYGFRGADDRAFARFIEVWGDAQTVQLTQNRRSASAIVRAASAVITGANARFAPGKALERAPDRPEPAGASVEAVRIEKVPQGGPVIASMVKAIQDRGEDLSRVAVIGRTWAEIERVRGALELAGVPIEVPERRLPSDDQGVQDVLAWATLACDPLATWAAVRVLTRPPLSVPPLRALEWEQLYRVERSREGGVEDDAPGDESGGAPAAFVAWCAARLPESDAHASSARRALELSERFAQLATSVRADEAIERIVRESGAAHADLLSGRDRAARVRAIVAMIRFVRARVGRLEQPRDLRAFLAYREDLDEREQGFDSEAASSVEPEESEGDRPVGVQLLTAHRSKGLEFDTVFVAGVQPRGFPAIQSAEPELPEALLDRVGDDRDAQQRRDDEERRLFYVACTRAERRLVLVGTVPKSRKSRLHFLLELLLADASGDLGLIERDGDELLGAQRDELAGSGELVIATEAGEAALERALREARLDAAGALGTLEMSPDDADAAAGAHALLVRAAGVVRVASAVRAGAAQPPAWADEIGLGSLARELVQVRTASAHAVGSAELAPPSGPLRLSYSKISQYLRCKRCYYVGEMLHLREGFSERAAIGSAVHRAIERFSVACAEADAEGETMPGLEALLRIGRRSLEDAWDEGEVLDDEVRERASAMLRTHFEQFHDPRAHVEELEWQVTLPWACDGQVHSVRMRLDRVERESDGGSLVIDYKTGGPKKALLSPAKDDLQMGLYALGLRHAREDESLGGACEYRLLRTGERGRIGFDRLDLGKVSGTVDGVIRGILSGDFEPAKGCEGPCSLLERA